MLAIFFAMIFWEKGGEYLFLILSTLTVFGVSWDICSMLKQNNISVFRLPVSLAAASCLLSGKPAFALLAILLFVFSLWGGILFAGNKSGYLKSALASIGVTALVLFTFVPLLIVYTHGSMLFMFLVLVTKAMDTGGYIFGMLSARLPGGNHKIVPSISPKKSWEGFFGGLLFSVGTAMAFYWCGALKNIDNVFFFILSGLLLGIGSFAGDLTESAVKRCCNIKDSGNYIPGMGGAFDVLDSFIYNGAIFAAMLIFV